MTGLAEWLLTQISADEKVASGARHCDRPGYGAGEDYDTVSDCDCGDDHAYSSYLAVDPARVLAECAAKRKIIELARTYDEFDSGEWAFDRVLRHLAAPYSDRPGFREEWRV